MNILLLEDDVILSEILNEHLSEKGYFVSSVYDGEEAYEMILKKRYDLMLLDVNVPLLSGFELLKLLKEQYVNIPTIFITSLDSAHELKKGFDLGCDDYLKKPFELLELDARIEHLVKVNNLESSQIKIDEQNYLDKTTYELVKNGNRVKLSKKDFEITRYFLSQKGSVVSHAQLIANIWFESEVPSDATLRTYIKNIRAHLGKDFITTIKGVGYRVNIQ
ncbi:response regulator transcription factor [Sulfurimonas crateris]|uniref:Response regulator transcription factor n=1 Tax=Sulfurimonas crateris TaxID=2574727 RepID=A0A4V5TP28_9BACT|nr:response regulator transcription factor [Sulfurimonas crateris]TKI69373.1 response regulator transcription factor [Sulfurimonas crateris]